MFKRFAVREPGCNAVWPGLGNNQHHHRPSEQPHVLREVIYVLSTRARVGVGPESMCNRSDHQKEDDYQQAAHSRPRTQQDAGSA